MLLTLSCSGWLYIGSLVCPDFKRDDTGMLFLENTFCVEFDLILLTIETRLIEYTGYCPRNYF